MSTQSIPGIYKKLHAIMSEANYIQKDKKNPHFGYSYASEAAIKETLHKLFVKHGVLFSASVINQQILEISRNEKGKPTFRTTLDLAYKFIDVEDGSFLEGVTPGSGVDGEDKGTYKAITGALKYCLTTQFIIPTGDDPEDGREEKAEKRQQPAHRSNQSKTIGGSGTGPARPHEAEGSRGNEAVQTSKNGAGSPPTGDPALYITPPQHKRFFAICNKRKEEADWEVENVKALLRDFGVESSSHIVKADYDKICNIIEKRTYAEYRDYQSNPPEQQQSA